MARDKSSHHQPYILPQKEEDAATFTMTLRKGIFVRREALYGPPKELEHLPHANHFFYF